MKQKWLWGITDLIDCDLLPKLPINQWINVILIKSLIETCQVFILQHEICVLIRAAERFTARTRTITRSRLINGIDPISGCHQPALQVGKSSRCAHAHSAGHRSPPALVRAAIRVRKIWNLFLQVTEACEPRDPHVLQRTCSGVVLMEGKRDLHCPPPQSTLITLVKLKKTPLQYVVRHLKWFFYCCKVFSGLTLWSGPHVTFAAALKGPRRCKVFHLLWSDTGAGRTHLGGASPTALCRHSGKTMWCLDWTMAVSERRGLVDLITHPCRAADRNISWKRTWGAIYKQWREHGTNVCSPPITPFCINSWNRCEKKIPCANKQTHTYTP